ncbi:MAG: hypothetical protein H0W78_15040 [Planctomycetes bacterium]|nr:hypothetical protein [Planctomycetota bacterium]
MSLTSTIHPSLPPLRSKRFAFLAFIATCLLTLAAAPASAATWSGLGTDNMWTTPGNWEAQTIPLLSGDTLIFPAAAEKAGGPANNTSVNNIGDLNLLSISIVGAFTINSTYTMTCPTINASATATLAAPLAIPVGQSLTINQTTGIKTLSLTGLISGSGLVTIGGAGITEFTGSTANTYDGLTSVETSAPGYLRLARSAESIPGNLTIISGAKVIIDATTSQIHYDSVVNILGTVNTAAVGILDISLARGLDSGVDNETIGALEGTGRVDLGTRRLGCYVSPVVAPEFLGSLNGTAASSFRKHGSFTQRLSGTNDFLDGATVYDFLGTTVLNGGALTVLGGQSSSNITATAGTLLVAKLAHVGAIAMSGSSNLSVGNDPGNQNQAFSKSLSLTSSTRMDVFSGAGNSTLTVTGTVSLGSATLLVTTDSAVTAGTDILIIDNDGTDAVSGTFASLPQGAELLSSGTAPTAFTISYRGGANDNDVVLTALTAPTSATASNPVINSAGIASGVVGTAFSYQITATNTPTSFTASYLPAGLSMNASGLISGTPTTAGFTNVVVGATNASGTGSRTVATTIDSSGPGVGGGNPAPPGPTSTGNSGSSSGCGNGSGGLAVLALALMLGLSISGGWHRRP